MNQPADLEYAIKKDVRNNPIIREADTRQHREFSRTAAIWALIVVMFLFAAWQHASVLQNEYQIERLLQQRAAEEAINRRLRSPSILMQGQSPLLVARRLSKRHFGRGMLRLSLFFLQAQILFVQQR